MLLVRKLCLLFKPLSVKPVSLKYTGTKCGPRATSLYASRRSWDGLLVVSIFQGHEERHAEVNRT